MATELSSYSIYQLTFSSYLKGFGSVVPKEKLSKLADFIFENINGKITYQTGSKEDVQSDPVNRMVKFNHIACTRIQRHAFATLTENGTHQKNDKIDDYPCINVLFDCRTPDVILIAVQKNARFATPEITQRGLQSYFESIFQEKVKEDNDFCFNILIEPMRLARDFWGRLGMQCQKEDDKIKNLSLRVKNPDRLSLEETRDMEWMAMKAIARLRKRLGSKDSDVNFGFDDEHCIEVKTAEQNLGKYVAAAMQDGFEVCAMMHSGRTFSSSSVEAANYMLGKEVVGDYDNVEEEITDAMVKAQTKKLAEWFDKIHKDYADIQEMNNIYAKERTIKK